MHVRVTTCASTNPLGERAKRGRERAEAHARDRDQQDLPAPDPVRERQQQERRHRAEARPRREATLRGGVEPERGGDLRQRVAEHAEVVVLEEHRERDEAEHAQVRGSTPAGTPPRNGGIHHGLRRTAVI
jgi:hypothetical protein